MNLYFVSVGVSFDLSSQKMGFLGGEDSVDWQLGHMSAQVLLDVADLLEQ